MRKIIDKKACRKVAVPKFCFDKENGLLHCEQFNYVVRTQAKNVAGKRLLILYIYAVNHILKDILTPTYVVFQGKDDYLTLEYCEDGKTKWRKAETSRLGERKYRFDKECAFYSHSDEKKVIQFCDSNKETGFKALSCFQERIHWQQCLENDIRKRRNIKNQMRPVDKLALPRGLKPWIVKDLLPAHFYYYYRKGKQVQHGYCTHCKTDVSVEKPRHNQQAICPNCGREVTCHAIGKNARVLDQLTTQVVQRVGEGVVVRICKAYADYSDYKQPQIRVHENARIFYRVENGECVSKPFYYSYGYDKITNWKHGERPERSPWYYYFEADLQGYVYPYNLDKELKGTPWQYSQLKEFCLYFNSPFLIKSYLCHYIKGPALEYLMKLKLYQLAIDTIYCDVDSRFVYQAPINLQAKQVQEVLGVEKQYVSFLQEVNISLNALELMQKLIEAGYSVKADFIKWCMQHRVYQYQDIILCLNYMSMGKFMRYITEQFHAIREIDEERSMGGVVNLYKDYLRFSKELDYNLQDDFLLFPRDVKDAHDRVSQMIDRKKVQKYNNQIADEYPNWLEQYQMTGRKLMVIPPKNAEEIVAEGQKLHHCVGGYVTRVVNKECVILFLRERKNPETPFYTIEVRGGKVQQIRGRKNCEPTAEIETYMEQWKKEKLKPLVEELAA